jgi:hypothetical protein
MTDAEARAHAERIEAERQEILARVLSTLPPPPR